MSTFTEEAYEKSLLLLHSLATEKGFIASSEKISNYRRVWARDGVVAGLASLVSGDSDLISVFLRTLRTLKENQDETGRIPSNVSIDEKTVSYGTTVGRIDASIWYIIGVCQYIRKTEDKKVLSEFKESIYQALMYLRCIELNGRGLLYIPSGGDWADEYINHGYVLFDEVLYYIALQNAYAIFNDAELLKKKDALKELILVNYFPKEENKGNKYIYNEVLFNGFLDKYKPPLPVAYFSTHSIRQHIDSFAISLLLLTDITEDSYEDSIRDAMNEKFLNKDFPILPAFHPVIKEGDENWDHLRKSFLFSFKNMPYQFHNGGLWPLVQGFFITSMGGRGVELLEKFAEILKKDDYIFPEYLNGKKHTPEGTKNLGFSAAAYVIAHNAVLKNKMPFL